MSRASQCKIEGCGQPHEGRGWCKYHYNRWWKYGNPTEPHRKFQNEAPEVRFWEKVDKNGPLHAKLGRCWQWMGGHDDRYGKFRVAPNRMIGAHRFAYQDQVGPIPEGLTIDHLCRNTLCVNPAHLEPVTQRENNRRGESPTWRAVRLNQCYKGHEFTPENTQVSKDGKRSCITCLRTRQRAYYKAHGRKDRPPRAKA